MIEHLEYIGALRVDPNHGGVLLGGKAEDILNGKMRVTVKFKHTAEMSEKKSRLSPSSDAVMTETDERLYGILKRLSATEMCLSMRYVILTVSKTERWDKLK